MGILARLFGSHHSAPSRPGDTASAEMRMFVDASLALAERTLLELPRPRLGARWYFLGAAECLAEDHALSVPQRRALIEQALRPWGGPPVPTEAPAPDATQARAEGAATLEQWLHGKDNNAALRLSELLREWERAERRGT